MVAAYNLVWANTDFELQHCGVAVRRRHSPFEVAYTITSKRPQRQSFRYIVLDLRTQP